MTTKKNEIAFQRVAKMLDEGMVQGQMHQCLRGAGRLAGGFVATGVLGSGDVEDLKRMAVGRSIDKKLGARTFDKAVDDGRKEPVVLDMQEPASAEAREIGWDDPLPRPIAHRTDGAKIGTGEIDTSKTEAPKYAKIIDKTWIQSAEVPAEPKNDGWEAEQFKRYLADMFEPEEKVGLCLTAWLRKSDDGEGKWIPDAGVWDRTRKELVALIDRKKGDLSAVLGDPNADAGAWVRVNPLDGNGCADANVTAFRHTLIEADGGDLGSQLQTIRDLNLPCSCIVHSGKKSIHALVRVCAKDMDEYKARVDYLHGIANANGLKADPQTKNPSRLSRLPGFNRAGKKQYIIDDRCGLPDWESWVEWIEDKKDDLPDFEPLDSFDFDNLPAKKEEIISGILRKGHKLTITGPSKAGKSFDLLELAAAVASGGTWHGWKCTQGRALYVNLELDKVSSLYRMRDIFIAKGIPFEDRKHIDYWNLRGRNKSLDMLAPKLIRRAQKRGYDIIILDPIYKILTGDENNAADMAEFTNLFDTITEQLKCAVVCCHHHSKGSQGAKRSADRGSGSGVFSRDPDAILDLIELMIKPEARKQLARVVSSKALTEAAASVGLDVVELYGEDEAGDPEGLFMSLTTDYPHHDNLFRDVKLSAAKAARLMSGWRVEATLREFEKPDNAVCWFKYPVHIEDATGILTDAKAEGEEPAWQAQMDAKKAKKEEEKKAAAERKRAEKEAAEANKAVHGNIERDTLFSAIEQAGGWGVATKAKLAVVMKQTDYHVGAMMKRQGVISRRTGTGKEQALFKEGE